MRISVRNSDPGYFEGSYRCTVFLDGVKLDDCVTADEQEGLALCYDMEAARPGEPVPPLMERRGKVRIETRDDDGVCFLCGAGAGVMHLDNCRRQRPRYFAIGEREWKPGDSPVLPPIDDATKTAYAAIRIKASDRLPCPVCGHADPGHEMHCHVPAQLRAVGIDPDAVKITRVTDDPDRVTIPLTFERLRADMPPSHEMGRATGGPVPAGMFKGLVGERGPAPVFPLCDPDTGEPVKKDGKTVTVTLHGGDLLRRAVADSAERIQESIRRSIGMLGIPRHIAEAADKAQRAEALKRLGVSEDDLRAINAEMRPLTADDFNAILGEPRPSRMSRIIAARRKRFKAAPFTTEHDEGVHRAISAMQRPGRANDL